jgi:ribokinase
VVNRYELDALPEAPRLTALTLGAEGAIAARGRGGGRARGSPEGRGGRRHRGRDAFTACMVVSLLEGRDREEALSRSCAAGALAASRMGAQPSLPTAAEIDEILRR